MIVGIEQFAASAKRAIDKDNMAGLKVVAFIDPNCKQEGNSIEDVRIYNTSKIEFLVQKYGVSRILIAQKNLDPVKEQNNRQVPAGFNVKVQVIPDATAWINGEA